jgi:EAL domain-containing protein (putative c-di-GMP-specific phosphodiesterase class I)
LEVSAWVRALDFGERRLALAEYSTSLTPGDSPLVEHLGYSPLLMALGIKVALDDFGAGYGGFAYLKRLPVSYLKIDREFVNDLVDEISSQHVVSAVVNLAKAFGMLTIAEGAEDEATVRLLQELGVDHVQGFVVGRPLPMSAAFGTTGFSGRA